MSNMNGQMNAIEHFRIAKETLANNPLLHHPDPNILWIIETDASKRAFTGILL